MYLCVNAPLLTRYFLQVSTTTNCVHWVAIRVRVMYVVYGRGKVREKWKNQGKEWKRKKEEEQRANRKEGVREEREKRKVER